MDRQFWFFLGPAKPPITNQGAASIEYFIISIFLNSNNQSKKHKASDFFTRRANSRNYDAKHQNITCGDVIVAPSTPVYSVI